MLTGLIKYSQNTHFKVRSRKIEHLHLDFLHPFSNNANGVEIKSKTISG